MLATFNQNYRPSAQLVSRARKDVAGFAAWCGFGCEQISDIVLAVGEAVNNAVEHAGSPHDFDIRCEFDSDRLLVEVKDHGSGFAPPTNPAKREQLQPRGLGIYLMNQLMDKAEFSFKPGDGTVLTLEKRKSATNLNLSKNMLAVLGAAV